MDSSSGDMGDRASSLAFQHAGNETKEHIGHLFDFRDTLTKMRPFLKALLPLLQGWLASLLAEVEEAGGSWYLFLPPSFPKELGDNYGLIYTYHLPQIG